MVLSAIRGLFSKKNVEGIKKVAEVVTEGAENVKSAPALQMKNGVLAADTLTFGWKSASEETAELIKKYQQNLKTLREGGASESVIQKFAEVKRPVSYTGPVELTPTQTKSLELMKKAKERRMLEAELKTAEKNIRYAQERSEYVEKAISNFTNSELRANYSMTFEELLKRCPEARTEANLMKIAGKLVGKYDGSTKYDVMKELAKLVQESGNEETRANAMRMIAEDLQAGIKKMSRIEKSNSHIDEFLQIRRNVHLQILFSKDKAEAAKQIEKQLDLINDPRITESFMVGIRAYGETNPSDMSFIGTINKAITSKMGNPGVLGYDALAAFDNQYYHIRDVYKAKGNAENLFQTVMESAKTEAERTDFVEYLNDIMKTMTPQEKRSFLHTVANRTVVSHKPKAWFVEKFLKPNVEGAETGSITSMIVEDYRKVCEQILYGARK